VGRHLIVVLAGAVACAATFDNRSDYILAHPHGWVEVSIVDTAIPAVPVSQSEGKPVEWARPLVCSIDIRLDREPFARGDLYPAGDRPPFSAKSGFRFPAPVGPSLLTVNYSGCDLRGGELAETDAQLYIGVEDSRVVEVHFDGTELVADPPRDNSVVTLDDLYEAVTGRPKATR